MVTRRALDDFKDNMTNLRRKKIRLRSIFLRFRKHKKFEYHSDIILLKCIILALDELCLPYSIDEIYSAFKYVSKNDYDTSHKKQTLKFLTENAQSRSVFKK